MRVTAAQHDAAANHARHLAEHARRSPYWRLFPARQEKRVAWFESEAMAHDAEARLIRARKNDA